MIYSVGYTAESKSLKRMFWFCLHICYHDKSILQVAFHRSEVQVTVVLASVVRRADNFFSVDKL